MMPVISLEKVTTAAVVRVEDLTTRERMAALYASDMPNRFRAGSVEATQVAAWIVQGAERLGAEELRRRAVFSYGQRLMEMGARVPVHAQAAHERRFPRAGRLDQAERAAAGSTVWARLSASALARNADAEVEGGCPCGGRGWIAMPPLPEAPDAMTCPVHGREATRRHAAGQAVSA
ncbi:hypothetical protein OG544_12820 [Streptomyces albidoflavus]|uniref:hypothetical protein n=1 Tax=Streptomyces albidoflavus TaxID=1886 RepID=UPI001A91F597|nr:hypothetical protein [Streptomyces albidoflavus]